MMENKVSEKGKESRFDSARLIENRRVCIFLSSTFSDMQEERSALIKTFEALKIKANRRNVSLSVLDLRWGVTDEEARSGKVISVCLNEIEHSHPFFIGLLGSRYGYAPDPSELERNPELKERYPWIVDDINAKRSRSITEIEMLYGALRNEGKVDAVFYIKQTTELDDDPRLTGLKDLIRAQTRFPKAEYDSVPKLCSLVELEVTAMIDRHFPDIEVSTLDRLHNVQRAHITSHHEHFVGREEDLKVIDDFVRSNGRHLVITGDSGIGKSALMAQWIRCNEKNHDYNLVYHFMGNSFTDSNYESALRHICDEIYDLYKISRTPERQEKIEKEAQWLVDDVAKQQKNLVIIIDGINQMLAPKDEKLLLWLPVTNDKVKFIFSTLRTDNTMQTFERNNRNNADKYRIHELSTLRDEQRDEFLVSYLNRVGKHLNEKQRKRILSDSKNHNILVLRTLLDELICFGSHEELDNRIDFYLSANGIDDFFDRVLQRLEHDYSNGQDLVCQTLTLIALSEHGLSEEELLSITGFRQIDWHLFYCAAFNHLVVREGLVSFSHQYIASAVDKRFLVSNDSAVVNYRNMIVNHFAAWQTDDLLMRQRRISELSYQYNCLKDWRRLHDVLLSFEAFDYFSSTNVFLLAKYWRDLRAADKDEFLLSGYINLPCDDNGGTASLLNEIGSFVRLYFEDYLVALDYHQKALSILLIQHEGNNKKEVADSYHDLAFVYHNLGNYQLALEYNQKALKIRKKEYGRKHLVAAASYHNLGSVYREQGKYLKSLAYYFLALRIAIKQLGEEQFETACIYKNIGSVCQRLGLYRWAMNYTLKDLQICEKIRGANHPDTAISYNDIGRLYRTQKEYSKSIDYYNKALAIQEKIFGMDHSYIATTYNNIACSYSYMGQYEQGLIFFEKALEIRKKRLGVTHPDTQRVMRSIENVNREMNKLNDGAVS